MNSSNKSTDGSLVRLTPNQAKKFLIELANLDEEKGTLFFEKYDHILPRIPDLISLKERIEKSESEISSSRFKLRWAPPENYYFSQLSRSIRQIWVEPNLRAKKYGVFLLWGWAMFPNYIDRTTMHIPELPTSLPNPSGFEAALQVLLDQADLTRYCANPDCPAPYFFAKRRSQKYCGEDCAKPAQREFKRKWWADHGNEWRTERKAQKISKKGEK